MIEKRPVGHSGEITTIHPENGIAQRVDIINNGLIIASVFVYPDGQCSIYANRGVVINGITSPL